MLAATTVALAAGIVVVVGFGIAHELRTDDALWRFDLDEERSVPAGWSALVLLGGAALALWAAWRRLLGWESLALAGVLGALAIDEWLLVHERVESKLDVPWQLVYAPLAVVGAIAVVSLLRPSRGAPRAARVLLATATASWTLSVVLESIQWWDHERHVDSAAVMVGEELTEIVGAALVVVALVVVLVRAPARVPAAADVAPTDDALADEALAGSALTGSQGAASS